MNWDLERFKQYRMEVGERLYRIEQLLEEIKRAIEPSLKFQRAYMHDGDGENKGFS